MAQAPAVNVVGLKAFMRDLSRAAARNGELEAAMKRAGNMAALPVAIDVRSRVPQASGKLAGSVRTTSARTGAFVRMGGASQPYAGWVEFGGTRHAPWESSRPYYSAGRYMFPAAARLASTSAEIYSDGIGRALADFGWSNPTTDAGAVHD